MNKFYGVGRATAKPELRDNGKTKVIKFGLAINRTFTNSQGQKETDFINCIAFSKTAELIDKYVNKGDRIAIEGRVQTGSYDNKEGKKVYTTDIVVDQVEFLESKKEATNETKSITTEDLPTENPFAEYGQEIEEQQEIDLNDDTFLE